MPGIETNKIVDRDQVRLMLLEAGIRPTRQRMALAELLFDGVHKHVTAEQLFEQAQHGHKGGQNAHVSLATVYNTLHQFTEAGLLDQVVVDANRVYFDTNVGDHHHFYDAKTGMLTDIPADQVKLSHLPPMPGDRELDRVDIIVRVK
jgi:Fur family iron response transcriptional regulator